MRMAGTTKGMSAAYQRERERETVNVGARVAVAMVMPLSKHQCIHAHNVVVTKSFV